MTSSETTFNDAELIARLRASRAVWENGRSHPTEDESAAADRIEALIAERDEADDLAKAAFADGASNNIRLAETSYRVKWLEAKLAKAVVALEGMCLEFRQYDLPYGSAAYTKATGTLAEIKGGNDAESNL